MSQISQLGTGNIIPSAPQSNASLNSTASHVIVSSPTVDEFRAMNNFADRIVTALNYSNRGSSGSSDTSASTHSSTSNASNTSSLAPARSRPMPYPDPNPPTPSASKINQRSSLSTVHFAETEPLPRSPTRPSPMSTIRSQPGQAMYTVPKPLSQYQNNSRPYVLNLTPSMRKSGEKTTTQQAMPPPPSILVTRPKRLSTQAVNTWTTSTPNPVTPSSTITSPEPKRRHTLLPTSKSVSVLPSGSRAASHNSTRSAPAALSTPPNPAIPQGQYNPLQHYVPCLYPSCSAHYTAAYAGSMYYVPQGVYSLSRLHGYCQRHATKELADASALCKREWEFLRQSAGRKTLGQIGLEFETFMKHFRNARAAEDAQLQQDLKNRVVGMPATATVGRQASGKPKVQFDEWDWRYTPRRCTSPNCKSAPYSPYASHLYAFYNSPRPSTFTLLHTLCPRCAKKEIEAFEHKVSEKWSSRSNGWKEQEWEEWFGNVMRDREMEGEFWEKTQEKAIKEKGLVRRVEKVGQGKGEKAGGMEIKEKRKSMFRRLIVSMKA